MDKKQGVLGGGLLALWLVLTGLAFWHLEYRKLNTYEALPATDPQLVSELEEALATQSATTGPVLVHLYAADCACEQASRNHLQNLQTRYPHLEVRTLEREALLQDAFWPVPLSLPTAALFNPDGQLLYFGPYSSGPVCGTGINFVDNLLAGLAPAYTAEPWINSLAFGCFCDHANPNHLLTAR